MKHSKNLARKDIEGSHPSSWKWHILKKREALVVFTELVYMYKVKLPHCHTLHTYNYYTN